MDQLEIPKSIYELDNFGPELTLIMTISRLIVDWNSIAPSLDWVRSQIPVAVLKVVDENNEPRFGINEHLYITYSSILAGTSFALGLKYAGTFNKRVLELLLVILQPINDSLSKKHMHCHFNVQIYHSVLKNCLSTVCSAIAMVMAGSGNLSTFHRLKDTFDSLKDPDYGTNMAKSMCIGLLFVGSGLATVGTDDKSVASLFCSFFPIFPLHSADNRYHLQALRHLWVLALQRRCIVTLDAVNNQPIMAPIEMTVKNEEDGGQTIIKGFTPLLLPGYESLVKIQIGGPRFFNLELDLKGIYNRFQNTHHEIRIQLKSGFKTYEEV